MSEKEIVGVFAFAEAINSSWKKDRIFVSRYHDSVIVSGELELVLNFVSSVTSMFCAVVTTFDSSSDGSLSYRLF